MASFASDNPTPVHPLAHLLNLPLIRPVATMNLNCRYHTVGNRRAAIGMGAQLMPIDTDVVMLSPGRPLNSPPRGWTGTRAIGPEFFMPRQPRLDIAGIPQHVMQVGAGGAPVFSCADDRQAYLGLLLDASGLDGCDIHAYALAPSRVQLLVTGHSPGAVARMMRRVALGYARHANARDGRQGARWRGRYLSCPVGGHRHILLACAHVERSVALDPQASPGHHLWSSHAHNALGLDDRLVHFHPAYAELGTNGAERLHRYRELVAQSEAIDEVLAMHTRQGRAWGSDAFLQSVAAVLGVQVSVRPPGRPRKAQATVRALSVFFLSPFLLTDWPSLVETL